MDTSEDMAKLEKDLFELEQQLDIPFQNRFYNKRKAPVHKPASEGGAR